MFLHDSLNNVVYRYTISPGADPVLTTSIAVNLPGAVAVRSTGELFVTEYSAASPLSRFLSPLGTPVPNGTIANVGVRFPQEMRFVDDELWVLNSADHACSSEAQDIVRLAFDAQGTASAVGTVQTGLVGANRGMLWNPATRDLYVSQCYPVDTIQHFRVATDHTVSTLAPITANGLSNPHGMVITSWGELLVANYGVPSGGMTILRFLLDSQGSATANGTITGNGMNSLQGLAFAPWGELFIVNQGDASISRFTFDASHAAVPNGNFKLGVSTQVTRWGVGWITIVPGAPGG
jgi:hypothetical protein